MDDLARFCCQNIECTDHGKRGGGNLSVCDHYGPNKQRRMLYCATCKARFSERKGTPLFPKKPLSRFWPTSAKGAGCEKPVAWSE